MLLPDLTRIDLTTAYHRPACSPSGCQERASCALRIAVFRARKTR